jgi:hypothetical protein
MSRHGKPFAIATCPYVCVAALPLFTVCSAVVRASVDDGNIAEQADLNIVGNETADCYRSRRLCQELCLVNERTIRVRAEKVVSQDFLEAPDIAALHRRNVIAVQHSQNLVVCGCGGIGFQRALPLSLDDLGLILSQQFVERDRASVRQKQRWLTVDSLRRRLKHSPINALQIDLLSHERREELSFLLDTKAGMSAN